GVHQRRYFITLIAARPYRCDLQGPRINPLEELLLTEEKPEGMQKQPIVRVVGYRLTVVAIPARPDERHLRSLVVYGVERFGIGSPIARDTDQSCPVVRQRLYRGNQGKAEGNDQDQTYERTRTAHGDFSFYNDWMENTPNARKM